MRRITAAGGFLASLPLLLSMPGANTSYAEDAPQAAESTSASPAVESSTVMATSARLNQNLPLVKQLIGSESLTNVVLDAFEDKFEAYVAADSAAMRSRVSARFPNVIFKPAKQNAVAQQVLSERILAEVVPLRVAEAVVIREVVPQYDGTVEVITEAGSSDQARMNAHFGPHVTVAGRAPIKRWVATRGDDLAPWNGGDFIYYNYNSGAVRGGNCTSGVPLRSSSGVTYLLTAAHCFEENGTGVGTPMRNGYVDDASVNRGSGRSIANVSNIDRITNFRNTDSALIRVSASNLVFNGSWSSATKAPITAGADLGDGTPVCTSGAYSGRICNIIIRHHGLFTCDPLGNCTTNLRDAWRNDMTAAGGPGDSGGPVYALNANGTVTPVGMVDGGGNDVACADNPSGVSLRVCGWRLLYEDIIAIQNLWNLTTNY